MDKCGLLESGRLHFKSFLHSVILSVGLRMVGEIKMLWSAYAVPSVERRSNVRLYVGAKIVSNLL